MQKKFEPTMTVFQHNFFSQIWKLILVLKVNVILKHYLESLGERPPPCLILRIRDLLRLLTQATEIVMVI